MANALRDVKVPVVDLDDQHDFGFPRIRSDNRAIGQLGAEHLLERNFRHFAFIPFSNQT